jgi:hypothetical protein
MSQIAPNSFRSPTGAPETNRNDVTTTRLRPPLEPAATDSSLWLMLRADFPRTIASQTTFGSPSGHIEGRLPATRGGNGVQAVLITFVSELPVHALRERLERYTATLLSVPGLVMKSWIVDEFVLGGFYLFADHESAEAYLHGELCETLIVDPCFSYFKVNHYDVIDDLSAIAGSPEKTIRRQRQPADQAAEHRSKADLLVSA